MPTPADLLGRAVLGTATLLQGRKETVRRPVYVAATTAESVYLPSAAPGLGTSGVIIGQELYSGKGFVYCPFRLYGDVLPGPNMLVQGETGEGKSALVESYALRQIRFGRQVAVFSVKRQQDAAEEDEWAPPTRAVGGVVVSFRPGGDGSRINPLDPAIPAHLQHWLVRTMVETSSAALGERAQYALSTAHRVAVTRAAELGRPATLQGIGTALLNPSVEAATYAYPDYSAEDAVRQMIEVGRDVALAIHRLCDPSGDLAGMVDGPTRIVLSGDDDRSGLQSLLDAPLVDFDLSRVNANSAALPVLMAVLGTWLNHAWLRADGRKRILVVEEAWHVISDPKMAVLFEELGKFARGLGLSMVAVIHHMSDIDDTPEAAALLKMASTRVVYQQKAGEAEITAARLGLPEWATDAIPRLQRGVAVWDVAGNCQVVQHVTTAAERQVCFSDSAMTSGSAA